MALHGAFRAPTKQQLAAFLAVESKCDFTYSQIGASAGDDWPANFDHDRNRALLGNGESAFQAACNALRQWRQFPRSWTYIYPEAAPLEIDTNVAVVFRVFGTCWLNSARIVYTFDETTPVMRRFGFAYGTLPAHIECGEERFSIEMHDDGSVWYDLRAFSRPRMWLVRLGYPIARRFQRRFVRDSKVAMVAAVQGV
jgi:uncharacterized protein (UPF0548 family)